MGISSIFFKTALKSFLHAPISCSGRMESFFPPSPQKNKKVKVEIQGHIQAVKLGYTVS